MNTTGITIQCSLSRGHHIISKKKICFLITTFIKMSVVGSNQTTIVMFYLCRESLQSYTVLREWSLILKFIVCALMFSISNSFLNKIRACNNSDMITISICNCLQWMNKRLFTIRRNVYPVKTVNIRSHRKKTQIRSVFSLDKQ